MTDRIRATYEQGVFKPATPVNLPEGAEVFVVAREEEISESAAKHSTHQDSFRAIMQISKLADRSAEPNDGLSGSRDHDRILYGGPKGAL